MTQEKKQQALNKARQKYLFVAGTTVFLIITTIIVIILTLKKEAYNWGEITFSDWGDISLLLALVPSASEIKLMTVSGACS